METFLTVILFIFVGFWLLGLIGKWLLRYWVAKKQREFQQQFGGDGNSSGQGGGAFGGKGFGGFYTFGGFPGGGSADGRRAGETRQKKREGEVTIEGESVKTEHQVGKGVGEYVEYEEVEITQK